MKQHGYEDRETAYPTAGENQKNRKEQSQQQADKSIEDLEEDWKD